MRRIIVMSAAISLVVAASPMAFAAPIHRAPAQTATTVNHIEPGDFLARDLLGIDVFGTRDRKVGSIKNLILGPGARVLAVVLDIDGRDVGVPMRDIKIVMNSANTEPAKATVNMSKSQLKLAKAFRFDKAPGSGSSAPPASRRK